MFQIGTSLASGRGMLESNNLIADGGSGAGRSMSLRAVRVAGKQIMHTSLLLTAGTAAPQWTQCFLDLTSSSQLRPASRFQMAETASYIAGTPSGGQQA